MSGRPRVQGHAHVPDTESESRLTYSHGKSIDMAGLSARTTGASSGRAATSHISKPSGACPASGQESALAHACHARIIQAETVKPSGKHWRTTDMLTCPMMSLQSPRHLTGKQRGSGMSGIVRHSA